MLNTFNRTLLLCIMLEEIKYDIVIHIPDGNVKSDIRRLVATNRLENSNEFKARMSE